MHELLEISETIAQAIGRQDTKTLAPFLHPLFVAVSPGGRQNALQFLAAIAEAPYRVLSIRLEKVDVEEMEEGAALVTGIQHARVELPDGGGEVSSRVSFIDVFVRRNGSWSLRAANATEMLADE